MMNVDAVDAFFKATESFADAMVPTVAYVSWTRQGRQIVVKARLRLTLQGLDVAYRRFEWNGVIAETFPLAQIEKSQREFIEDILKGNLNSPNGLIEFPPQHGGGHAGQFVELHPDGLEQQSRTLVLQIRGDDQNSPLNFMPLDWDLKAADPPYDSLGELFQDFGLGLLIVVEK
ncbi:hypothetical protein [Sphingorhabdus sp. EL138]|uniref:hypothetical protein n=1 Tax=Sphingorhabdus sp. EL138 TaxID=2073156 RepID=UPI002601325C|nr:hypothetical protein [Sphingorhabdus sp. EL138]